MITYERFLGGPGSGNFDHAGRPGQVGGSATVFHGTLRNNVDAILRDGISAERAQGYSQAGHVYVTTDLRSAKLWAEEKATLEDAAVAVFRIRIPKAELSKLVEDENFADGASTMLMSGKHVKGNLQFKGSIKPEWIQEVNVRDGWEGSWKKRSLEDVAELWMALVLDRQRSLGGPGSGNHGHAGRPGSVGGSAPRKAPEVAPQVSSENADILNRMMRGERWAPPKTDEEKQQAELALSNPNPLARPMFVMGMDNDVHGETYRYVGAYGEEFKVTKLPADVERGKLGECYKNATLLVMRNKDLTYAEGFATNDRTPGFAFMHAWAIDKNGNVLDNTWEDGATYFGVKYDRAAYLKHVYKAEMYGVLGGEFKSHKDATSTGAYALRGKK